MNTAHGFTGNEQILHIGGHAVHGNVQSSVLVVQSGIYQNRLLADVNAVACKHPQHCRNTGFDGSLAADLFDHRRIQPDRLAVTGIHAFCPIGALPDDGRCGHISGFQRMHEDLAVPVDQLGTERPYLFSDQSAEDLLGECGTGGMIL